MQTRHIFDHKPTPQEVFNAACTYFAISEGPSTVASGRTGTGHDCVYRSDRGRVCAVGYFLPDDAYVPEMDNAEKFSDGSDVKALVRHYSDRVPSWFSNLELLGLLKSIQSLGHDDESNWVGGMHGTWHRENVAHSLRSIAHEHGIQDLSAIDVVFKRPNWSEVEA